MKKILLAGIMAISLQPVLALRILSGKEVNISQPVYEDLYIAGGNVFINAPVHGDLIISGGTVIINDSVFNDILLAGGTVTFGGYVGDDIRCAGGKIRISANVTGDVTAAGGEIIIDKGVTVGGLLVSGGNVTVNGDVNGNVKAMCGHLHLNGKVTKDIDCRGGTVIVNGQVEGKSILAAPYIILGNSAAFHNDVRYWSEQSALTFTGHMKNGKAIYDSSLRIRNSKWYFLGATSLFLVLWYLGMALLMILIIQYFFAAIMKKAANTVFNHSLKSTVTGLMFFIALPVAIVFSLLTVVGVPVGLLLIAGFILSILLATVILSIVAANWINNRYDKKWAYQQLAFTAFGIFVLLRLVFLTPVVGWIFQVLLVSTSFGGILLSIQWKKKNAVTQQSSITP